MLTVGSICSGFGGIELGLGHAGIPHRLEWVSEIDPTANTVLAHHWPDVPNLGDITHAQPTPVDLITAGFPCQDISHAGRQAGIHGERSGLWWRIRDVVGHLRPRYVLLENVAAITVNGGPAVVGSLAELGYDCRWGIVRASDAGAPHQRARWFCLATNSDSKRQQSQWRRSLQPGQRDTDRRIGEITDTNGTGRAQQVGVTGCGDTAVAAHDQRPTDDAHKLAGAQTVALRDRDAQQQQRNGSRTSEGHSEATGRHGRVEAAISAWGKYGPAVANWAAIIGRLPPPPVVNGRLNPRAVEWMMGLPDQWVNHGSRAAQLRCLGNGVVPQQAALAINQLSTPEQAGSGVLA